MSCTLDLPGQLVAPVDSHLLTAGRQGTPYWSAYRSIKAWCAQIAGLGITRSCGTCTSEENVYCAASEDGSRWAPYDISVGVSP